MSDVSIPQDTGDFRLVNRKTLDAVLEMPERARFVRGMFAWAGFKQVGIEYVRVPRETGETKYPLRKMIRFSVDQGNRIWPILCLTD
jgi:dolichol-phosphate mannosyltransferase